MSVETIEAGRRYRTGPESPSIQDVFEFAEALIEQYGLNKVNPTTGVPPASSETTGWTLHDAIGEFGTRLSPGGSKAAPVDTGRQLRVDATSLLMELIQQEGDFADDKAWENMPGRTQQEVLNLLMRAREEAVRRAAAGTAV